MGRQLEEMERRKFGVNRALQDSHPALAKKDNKDGVGSRTHKQARGKAPTSVRKSNARLGIVGEEQK